MRKLILFLLICISAKVNAQVYQEMPQYGYRANRMAFDSTLQIPTTCGIPTLRSNVTKKSAIAFDSCNNKLYRYNPKTFTWSEVSGGTGTTPSLQQVLDVNSTAYNKNVYFYDSTNGGGAIDFINFNFQKFGSSDYMEIKHGNNYSRNLAERIYFKSGGASISIGQNFDIGSQQDAFMSIGFNDYSQAASGFHKLKSGSNFSTLYTTTIPPVTGTLAMSVNGNTADANGNITISTGGNDTTKVPYTGANKNVNLGTNNITANAYFNGFKSMFAKNDTIVLSIDSTPVHLVKGSGGQAYKLPVATTLANGTIFSFNNNQSSGAINVLSNSIANTLVKSVPSGAYLNLELTDNTTATGIWDAHFQAPSDVSWSTNTLDYAGSITNATWNGNVVAINRGGTGSATQNFVDLTTNQTIAGTKTFSSAIKIPNSGSQLILQVNSDQTVTGMSTSTYPSPSELAYVKGVTSAIQTQFNGKLNISDSATMLSKYLRKTDTITLSNRIENKQTNLDLLQTIGYGIKAEPFGVTLKDATAQLQLTAGRVYFYPFNWNVSDSIRGVAWFNRAASTTNQNGYNGFGIYSLSGSTLTRMVFTTNDSTFWDCASNTWSTKTIPTTFLSKGVYFLAYQISSVTSVGTLPTIIAGDNMVIGESGGNSPQSPPSVVNPNGVKFSCNLVNATTSLPSSVAMNTTAGVLSVPYFMFY